MPKPLGSPVLQGGEHVTSHEIIADCGFAKGYHIGAAIKCLLMPSSFDAIGIKSPTVFAYSAIDHLNLALGASSRGEPFSSADKRSIDLSSASEQYKLSERVSMALGLITRPLLDASEIEDAINHLTFEIERLENLKDAA